MSPIDELYGNPDYYEEHEEANRVALASASAVGSLVASYCLFDRATTKVDAYFQMQRIQNEQSTKVLPVTTHDVDMGRTHHHEMERYRKIYNSIEWKELATTAACAFYCGILSVTLL